MQSHELINSCSHEYAVVVQGLKLWGWCDALTTDSDVEMEEES
jgi:hypothetical protein